MKICPKCGGVGEIKDDKVIGDHLKKKREAAGITLREVGILMGLSASYICDLEHGRRIWSAELEKRFHMAIDSVKASAQSAGEDVSTFIRTAALARCRKKNK